MDPYFYKLTYRFKLEKRHSEKDLLLIDNFLSAFQLLPKKHQKVWKVLMNYVPWRQHVFPSRKTIATQAFCCIKTVGTAVKNFEENGWLMRIRRPYTSNVYCIFEPLKRIDVEWQGCFDLVPGVKIHNAKISVNVVNNEQAIEAYEQAYLPQRLPLDLPRNISTPSYGNRFDSVRPFSVHKEMEQSFRKSYGHSIHVHDLPLKDSEKRILSRHEDYFLLRARTDILEQDKYSQIRNWGAAMEERAQVYKIVHEEKVHPQEARKRYLERREVRQRTKKKAA